MSSRRLDERAIIAMIGRLQDVLPAGYLGIGDDAAFLPGDPRGWLVTQDMLVDGRHFRWDWATPEQVGRKAAHVNLSDIAAMGGTPAAALTSLAVPPDMGFERIESLYRGLTDAFGAHGVVVVGGDTVGTHDRLVLDVTVLGHPSPQGPIRRHGAQIGDHLLVTATLGASFAGYQLLMHESRWPGSGSIDQLALKAHLEPQARVGLGSVLAPHVHAMTDISDGIYAEIQEMLGDRWLGAAIDLERLPIDDGTRAIAKRFGADPVKWALFGGEDYELLMAAPPEHLRALAQKAEAHGIRLTDVGVVTQTSGVRWFDNGEEVSLKGEGFNHFATTHQPDQFE